MILKRSFLFFVLVWIHESKRIDAVFHDFAQGERPGDAGRHHISGQWSFGSCEKFEPNFEYQ